MWWLSVSALAARIGPGEAYPEIQEALDSGEHTLVLTDDSHTYQGFVVNTSPQDRITIQALGNKIVKIRGDPSAPTATVLRGDVLLQKVEIRGSEICGLLATGPNTTVTLQDVEIRGNHADPGNRSAGGGARVNFGAHLIVEGGKFQDNSAAFGGAIAVEFAGSSVTLDPGTVIEDNTAIFGGGLDVFDAIATTRGAIFRDNTAALGGHVSVIDGQLIEEGSSFIKGSAAAAGSIYSARSSLTLTGSLFDDSEATEGAGGAILTERGELVLEGVTAYGSRAMTHGGVVAKVQAPGRKRMAAADFLNAHDMEGVVLG